ncbi:MAG: hypothetical protein OFPII_10540 [Osedax symbiont Rs1]|nr:MAG: hypothetical protein OFPII_10540 [Osedax symbiont Rs1]
MISVLRIMSLLSLPLKKKRVNSISIYSLTPVSLLLCG